MSKHVLYLSQFTRCYAVFPCLICFSLPTDCDNEMITFSSDEELVEALGSISGDVFRVYVKVDDQDGTFVGEGKDKMSRITAACLFSLLKPLLRGDSRFCTVIKNSC